MISLPNSQFLPLVVLGAFVYRLKFLCSQRRLFWSRIPRVLFPSEIKKDVFPLLPSDFETNFIKNINTKYLTEMIKHSNCIT